MQGRSSLYELFACKRDAGEEGKSAGVGNGLCDFDSWDAMGWEARDEARVGGISPQRGNEIAQAQAR
jgi:hypothetical protein